LIVAIVIPEYYGVSDVSDVNCHVMPGVEKICLKDQPTVADIKKFQTTNNFSTELRAIDITFNEPL